MPPNHGLAAGCDCHVTAARALSQMTYGFCADVLLRTSHSPDAGIALLRNADAYTKAGAPSQRAGAIHADVDARVGASSRARLRPWTSMRERLRIEKGRGTPRRRFQVVVTLSAISAAGLAACTGAVAVTLSGAQSSHPA